MQAPTVHTPTSPRPADAADGPLTWTSAPRRFAQGRERILGPIVLSTHDWTRPQPGSPRMFDQDFIEWFTTVNPWTLPAVYVPAAMLTFWLGVRSGFSVGASIGLFIVGVFLWTLLEYLIHRFSFHLTPRGRLTMILAYLIHGVHHAYPEDHRRWVTPPSLSLPIALALYFGSRLVLGPYVNPIGAGVAIGYMLYDLTHYYVHRGPLKSRVGRFLRMYHMQHHYAMPERHYGVSSPFWDYVFRTHR
jgi:sterol desaturase/sphingolipid hydroxylase (fatty acid hydroxylase superfamily)